MLELRIHLRECSCTFHSHSDQRPLLMLHLRHPDSAYRTWKKDIHWFITHRCPISLGRLYHLDPRCRVEWARPTCLLPRLGWGHRGEDQLELASWLPWGSLSGRGVPVQNGVLLSLVRFSHGCISVGCENVFTTCDYGFLTIYIC